MENCKIAFISEDKEKPIKIVFENDSDFIETNECMNEYVKRFRPMVPEQFIKEIFGTINIGVFNFSDMTDEEIDKIVSN